MSERATIRIAFDFVSSSSEDDLKRLLNLAVKIGRDCGALSGEVTDLTKESPSIESLCLCAYNCGQEDATNVIATGASQPGFSMERIRKEAAQ